ncbi:hypothetical protein [Calothrix sp. UHCC 0171]|uniref:hypothetical protein n=1 Tax=Calothrix sp. UHCC 0171 TaxID=3110245 RepID=UPI002B1E9A42|nr:hypothetical protein [Calothrix sp. UHCC 0171]MEA5573340.1 hypothetical protein [Calothrix sp. UHCC 0171]
MSTQPTKTENLRIIKTRLKTSNLPNKIIQLSAGTITILAQKPELDPVIQIIIDQNNTIKASNGRRLAAENKADSLQAKLLEFLNPSKSEIIQLWSKLFGKVTKDDDGILDELGAVSKESVREDLEVAEKIIEDATDIAQQYKNKYGQL